LVKFEVKFERLTALLKMQAGFVDSLNLKVKAARAINLGGKFDPNLSVAAHRKELKFKRFKTQI